MYHKFQNAVDAIAFVDAQPKDAMAKIVAWPYLAGDFVVFCSN